MVGGAYLPIGISGAVAGTVTGVVLNSRATVRDHRTTITEAAGALGAVSTVAGLAGMLTAIMSSRTSAVSNGAKLGVVGLGIGVASLGLAGGFGVAQLTPLNA